MNRTELLQMYHLIFENWRFQVTSNWQRTNYFAVIETAALGGVWKVISDGYAISGLIATLLGILLTAVWFLNDVTAGSYIDYWWRSLARIETDIGASLASGTTGAGSAPDLVSNYDANALTYGVKRCWLSYRSLMRAVPAIFMAGWLCCLLFAFYSCHTVR
jgi:hypothetical protein